MPHHYTSASGQAIYGGRRFLPAWLSALTPLTWATVGTNVGTDVDPAKDPTINPAYNASSPTDAPWNDYGFLATSTNDYSGGFWDEANGRFGVDGGGHAGFGGNFWMSIDLFADAPAWARRGYPSGSIQKPCASMAISSTDNSLLAGDGRPCQVHTYNLLVPAPNGDLVLLPGGYNHDGSVTAKGRIFRRATDDWDTSVAINAPVTLGNGGGCYDPVRNLYWHIAGNHIFSYDATTYAGTTAYYMNGGATGYWKVIKDPKRDLLLAFNSVTAPGADGHTGKCIFIIDPANPSAGLIPINVSGEAPWATWGVDYDENHDRYLIWDGGAGVTTLTPPATSPKTNAWTVGTLSVSTANVTPTATGSNHTYGRFFVSKRLNCAVGLNRLTEKLFAFRLE